MTEEMLTADQAMEVQKTALTTSLIASWRTPLVNSLTSYLGLLTPEHLDAPEKETAALARGTAVHDLGWMRRIAVRGEDRFRWLSGMLTNAVETLANGRGAYNLVLNAQGRIQGDCYSWRAGGDLDGGDLNSGDLEVQVTAEQVAALMAHFDRFIIMDDVELVPIDGVAALGLTGAMVETTLRAVGLPVLDETLSSVTVSFALDGGEFPALLRREYGVTVPHYSLWVAEDRLSAVWAALVNAGATPVGAAALESLRVFEGVPAYGIDIQSRDLAQETSQERALCFTKGCYLGQEIVERIRSRGQVHRHLRSLELFKDDENSTEAVAAGIELRVSGRPVGDKAAALVTSATATAGGRALAIAMVRAEAEVGDHDLSYAGGRARILKTPPAISEFQDGGSSAAEESL